MSSQIEPLKQAITLSEKMLAYAEAENWQAFFETETARQKWIVQIDTQQCGEQERQSAATFLAQLINLNQRLEQISATQRFEAISKIQELNQGNRATKAYQRS